MIKSTSTKGIPFTLIWRLSEALGIVLLAWRKLGRWPLRREHRLQGQSDQQFLSVEFYLLSDLFWTQRWQPARSCRSTQGLTPIGGDTWVPAQVFRRRIQEIRSSG